MSLLMEALKKAEQAKKKALTDQQAANEDTAFTVVDSEYVEQKTDLAGESEVSSDDSELVSELGIDQDELELELEKMLSDEASDIGTDIKSIEEVAPAISELSSFDDDSQQYTSKYDEGHSFALLDVNDNEKSSEAPNVQDDDSNSLIQDLSFELDALEILPETNEAKVTNKIENIKEEVLFVEPLTDLGEAVEKPESSALNEEAATPVLRPDIQKKFETIKARELTPKKEASKNRNIPDKRKKIAPKREKKPVAPVTNPEVDNSASFETKLDIKGRGKITKLRWPVKIPNRGTAIKMGLVFGLFAGVAGAGYVYVNGELQGYSTAIVHPPVLTMPLSESEIISSPIEVAESLPVKAGAMIADSILVGDAHLETKKGPTEAVKGVVAKKAQSTPKKLIASSPVKTKKKEVKKVIIPAKQKQNNKPVKLAAVESKKSKIKVKSTGRAGAFSVLHPQPVDKTYQLLIDAYNDLNAEKYESAKTKYTKVLQSSEYNRDALLGLAAIAISQNSSNVAQAYYSRLLQQNKQDSAALAGLVDLVSKMNPLAAESQLKTLLSQESGAAHLHFALGNAYVAQERWADAQSSFFNAFNIDRGSADYAYNLAVSLDMLGESEEAVKFYNKAITLSSNRRSLFNEDGVVERLKLLKNSLGAG